MLFTVSCTTPDSNKSETTGEPSDTAESTVPANGAKKVVTKTVKLYQTAERARVRSFLENRMIIPQIGRFVKCIGADLCIFEEVTAQIPY